MFLEGKRFMNIGNKILELRKKNNITQEELAERVGVSRQTISKWELGETSPDLRQSKELSKIFNVSLDELVDNDLKDVIVDKVSNTEQLAGLTLKILKVIGISFLVFVVLLIMAFILLMVVRKNKDEGRIVEKTIICNLHDEEYSYSFRFYEENGQIKEAGGDAYLEMITDASKYGDAYEAMAKIDAYVKDRGGSCRVYDEDKDIEERNMKIEVNGKELNVKLENNSSVDELLEKLEAGDIIIDAHDYGSFEKVGNLGFSLPTNDQKITTKPGDLILYQGNQITLYYDTNTWTFTKLGEVTNVSAAELKDILGDSDVKMILKK